MDDDGGADREAEAGPSTSTAGGTGPTPVQPGDGLLELIATTPEGLRSLNMAPGPKEHQTPRAAPRQAAQPSFLRPEDGVPWPATWLVETLESKTLEIENWIEVPGSSQSPP